ncbi:hypothetical protein B0T18DRAFT_124411 [Schizothecium vesticola]|uniref:Uncharacterized protein n=1 Tax=Schizothecium vesticola TaxID=314040 RepID=A0AA40F312_9PEZI|nr:hypothetical protein B0T18DRAFT_124411 [Schizothecium vesticola]
MGNLFWCRLSAALPHLASPSFLESTDLSPPSLPQTLNINQTRGPGWQHQQPIRAGHLRAVHVLEPGYFLSRRRPRSQFPTAGSVPQMQVHRKPEIVNASPVSPLVPNPFASPARSMDERPERLHPDARSHQ